jgi:hypothetical protein
VGGEALCSEEDEENDDNVNSDDTAKTSVGQPSAGTVTAENIKGDVREKEMLLQYE